MARITIVTRLRFVAALTPVILLVVGPFLAGGFYLFGRLPQMLHEDQLAALRAARGMEVALYKMEWGRTQPEARQILRDQRRRFGGWLDLAGGHLQSRSQARTLQRIAHSADPVFEAMLSAGPQDKAAQAGMRELHGLVNDLIASDEAAVLAVAERARLQARLLIGTGAVATVLVPWICFALMHRMTGRLQRELRTMRNQVDGLGAGAAVGFQGFARLNQALASLGFAKSDPTPAP